VVRLSAGRQYMTDELQALCFVAGANSIFIGDVLLTTKNPQTVRDANLLDRLGIKSKLDEAKDAVPELAVTPVKVAANGATAA
jgi:biotin synthase